MSSESIMEYEARTSAIGDMNKLRYSAANAEILWTIWSNLGGGLVAPVEDAVNLEAAECVQRLLVTEWPDSLTFIVNPKGYVVQYA